MLPKPVSEVKRLENILRFDTLMSETTKEQVLRNQNIIYVRVLKKYLIGLSVSDFKKM